MILIMKMNKTKAALAVGAALTMNAGIASASNLWSLSGYFEFYDATGVQQFTVDTDGDGINDSRDNSVTGSFDLFAQTGTFDTSNTFNGYLWHADVDTMFQPAAGAPLNTDISWTWTNRTFDDGSFTVLAQCRTGVTLNGCAALEADPTLFELGGGVTNSYTFQLTNAGQFAAGVFFDWSVNDDIPVLAVLQGLDDPSDGVFDVASVDSDGDGVPGTAMLTAPFPSQTPSFGGTMTCTNCPPPIPIPAAVWLFGSGLLGLVGVARRRKA